MLKQLLESVVPDQSRKSKVEISEPDQLTPMFSHGLGARYPTGEIIGDRHPLLQALLASDLIA